MSENDKLRFSETGIIGTASEVMGSFTRVGLRLAMAPVIATKDLPFGIAKEAIDRFASFPRAVGRAFVDFAAEMEGTGSGGRPDLDKPGVHTYRNNKKSAAILFVHGFGQNSENTWGRFVDLVAEDKKLAQWDIFLVGYKSNMMLDVAGLWSSSPPIDRLARFLYTAATNPPLDRYKSLGIVAHSMGGLVSQRALVDFPDLRRRVSHFICYASPSAGLKKAALVTKWKRQIRDMAKDSSFVTDLRQRWKSEITDRPDFDFRVVAGDSDEFVPSWSSLEPFPEKTHSIVPGDHLSIVGPSTYDFDLYQKDGTMHPSVNVLVKHLVGEADAAGPLNSARLAVEKNNFKQVIDELDEKREGLDDNALVMLALAYASIGQEAKAIEVVEERGEKSTDLMGVLAGRLKRRWILDRQQEDADRATRLYSDALARAEKDADPDQASYHAINVAFLALAVDNDKAAVEKYAKKALQHCAKASESVWKAATEGEANLYLGSEQKAISGYQAALDKNPSPRQITSMFQQAVRVAELLGNEAVAERLRALFRDNDAQD